MKRTIIFISIVVMLCAGWTVGWYFVEGQVVTAIDRSKAGLSDRGHMLECIDQETGGYPFRFSLQCERISYINQNSGLTFQANALRTAAQIYQPNKVVAEFDGPATLRTPTGRQIDLGWDSLRSSAKFDISGAERTSVHARELEVLDIARNQTIRIDDFQFHGRKEGENNLRVALFAQNVVSIKQLWPDFDLNAEVLLQNAHAALMRRPDIVALGRLDGLDGELKSMSYASGESSMIEIAGPFTIDKKGILTGTFNVKLIDGERILADLSGALPDRRDLLFKIGQVLKLATAETNGVVSVTIVVKDGNAFLGFIPLGTIGPLF